MIDPNLEPSGAAIKAEAVEDAKAIIRGSPLSPSVSSVPVSSSILSDPTGRGILVNVFPRASVTKESLDAP